MGFYDNLPYETLGELIKTNSQAYIELTLAPVPDQAKMTAIQQQVELMQAALVNKSPVCVPVSQTQTQVNNYAINRRLKEMGEYFSKVSEFGPGQNLTLFLKECENIYNIVVTDCKELEPDFCRRLRMQLCSDYVATANNYHAVEPLDTFEKIKSFLRSNYEDSLSAYQHFQKLDSMERGSSETVAEFARRVQSVSLDVRSVIFEKYKRHTKKLVKSETETTEEMTASDLMDFMSGQVVLRSLKDDREAFNHIVDDLDKCWNAQDISTRASGFIGRRVKNDQLFPETEPKVNFAKKTPDGQKKESSGQKKRATKKSGGKKRKGACHSLIFQNKCEYGDRCIFSHDPELILSTKKLMRDNLNGQENSNKGRKPWKNSANVNLAQGDEDTEADLGRYSLLSDFQ